MPESIEQWLWLIISFLFIGFAFAVILVIFQYSPIVWFCLGLLVAILLLYPIVRNFPTTLMIRKQRRAQIASRKQQSFTSHQSVAIPKHKQEPLAAKQLTQRAVSQHEQLHIAQEIEKSSLEEPDVQRYVPPGLPPELFLS